MQRELPYCIKQHGTCELLGSHCCNAGGELRGFLLQESSQCSGTGPEIPAPNLKIPSFSALLQFQDSESQKVPLKIKGIPVD